MSLQAWKLERECHPQADEPKLAQTFEDDGEMKARLPG